jgi:hypothetical protein
MTMSLSGVVHQLIEVASGRKAVLSPDEADALHASADESAVLPVSADESAAEEAAPAPEDSQPESVPEPGPAEPAAEADGA